MTRLEIHGGLECDALPSGAYACVIADGTRVQTHLGDIPTAEGISPRYVRCCETLTPFRLAGQASHYGPAQGPLATWSQSGGWQFMSLEPCGVNPVIWDRDGQLHVSDCSIGSQGWRYVDLVTGALVTGDATHSSTVGVADWTDLGEGLLVGSCNVVPGVALYDGVTLRMIEAGDCQLVRATRAGSQVAIAIEKTGGAPAVLLWLTVDELKAMPIVGPAPDPPFPQIGRPLWLGFFVFGTSSPDAPGNCTLPAPRLDGILYDQAGHAMLRLIDTQASEGDIDVLEAEIAAALTKDLLVLAYWTRALQSVRVPHGAEHVLIDGTVPHGEGMAAFEARLRGVVAMVPKVHDAHGHVAPNVWICGECYTNQSPSAPDLTLLPAPYARIARDCDTVAGILIFHDGALRDDGWVRNPQARPNWIKLAAGITGTPPRIMPRVAPPGPHDPPDPIRPPAPAFPPVAPALSGGFMQLYALRDDTPASPTYGKYGRVEANPEQAAFGQLFFDRESLDQIHGHETVRCDEAADQKGYGLVIFVGADAAGATSHLSVRSDGARFMKSESGHDEKFVAFKIPQTGEVRLEARHYQDDSRVVGLFTLVPLS